MLSTLLVVGVISHLWCAARLVGIAHHSFYSVGMANRAESGSNQCESWAWLTGLRVDPTSMSHGRVDPTNVSHGRVDPTNVSHGRVDPTNVSHGHG